VIKDQSTTLDDTSYLNTLPRARDSEEFPLVGATEGVAGCHLIPFSYLILYAPEEVGEGILEVAYLALYVIRSPDLSGLGIRVIADEVGVEHLVDYLGFALSEALFHKPPHFGLVLFRHIEVSFHLSYSL